MVLIIFLNHESEYRWTEYFTKPLTLLILISYFLSAKKGLPKKLISGITVGLFFSILSDEFFLLRNSYNEFFIIGTFASSLIAIYSYARGFQHTKNHVLPITGYKSITLINFFLSLLIVIFPISIFIIEDLEVWQYPAIMYQLLLWVLISQGLKRQDHVNEFSYYLVLGGIVMYSITTMLLTLQNFTTATFDFQSFPVLTYFLSQYLIVVGAIYQKRSDSSE
jgi:hypothetical protein